MSFMINQLTEEASIRRSQLTRLLLMPVTNHCTFQEKWWGLKGFGYTDEQCDRECRPKQIDMEEQMEMVREAQERELRELAKYNREQAKLRKMAKEREARQLIQQTAPESFKGSFDGLQTGLGI